MEATFSLISNSEDSQPQVFLTVQSSTKTEKYNGAPVLTLRNRKSDAMPVGAILRTAEVIALESVCLLRFPTDTPASTWHNHQEGNAFQGQVSEGEPERSPK